MNKTTFEISKETNVRATILQSQLNLINPKIKNRDMLLNQLLNEHYELEQLKQQYEKLQQKLKSNITLSTKPQ